MSKSRSATPDSPRCRWQPILAALVVLLSPAEIAAQSSYAGAAAAGSEGLAVTISVKNSHGEIPMENIGIEILEQSNLLTNVTIEPQRVDLLAPGERLDLTVRFDIVAGAPIGAVAAMTFVLSADAGVFIDPNPSFEIAIAPDPAIATCVLRTDAPGDFPYANAIDYCDPDIDTANEYDRIAVFFTPPRDLREPLENRAPFIWRILGPNGHQVDLGRRGGDRGNGIYSGAFAPELEDGVRFAKEGSPGRLVQVIDLWDRNDRVDPAAASTGPGTYTVQTAEAEYYDDAGTGAFGGGESYGRAVRRRVVGHNDALSLPGSEILAEWEDAATFEIASSRLYFQGFVTEHVKGVKLPDREDLWAGELTLEDPIINGSSVALDANAWWQKAEENEQGERVPAAETHRASSRLTLDLPQQLAPGHEVMGEMRARIEPLEERGDFFFGAGMYLMIPTSPAPPDRHLVEGADLPPFWAGRARRADGYPFDDFAIVESTGETNATWVWDRGPPGGPYFGYWYQEASQLEVRVLLGSGDYDDMAGQPARSLPALLHDAETLWVIPFFVDLTDELGAGDPDRTLAMKSYGYAIYAARPGSYDGPRPTDGPEAGAGEEGAGDDSGPGAGDDPGGNNPGGNDPGGGGDDPGGEGGGNDPTGDPNDPNTINPAEPDIAALIRQWITVAEPPKNATEGANFHYNPRGKAVGTTRDGGIVFSARDDNLPFDATYLWQNRMTLDLDSVNHCRLEEYVVANLEGSAIDHCAGRYTAPDTVAVADVFGLPAAEAKSRLEDAGLTVAVAVVAGAASAREAFTVRDQRPVAGSELAPGSEVELGIFGDYNPVVVVPDVSGMPAGEAEALLKEAGLEPALAITVEATSEETSFSVYEQRPRAGREVSPGTRVELSLYGFYEPLVAVPDFQNLTWAEAQRLAAEVGIVPARTRLGPAPSPGLSDRVAAQSRAAREQVAQGTAVDLDVYGEYVPPERWAAVASSAADSGTWNRGWNYSSQQEAEAAALAGCQGRAGDCTIRAAFTSCAAYARDTSGGSNISWRDTVDAAESAVIERCRAGGGDCQLEMTFCADGSNQWATDNPIVPPPPERWAAFSSSSANSGTWTSSWNQSSQQEAEAAALQGCQGRAGDCEIRVSFTSCGAYVRNTGGGWQFSARDTVGEAERDSLQRCRDAGGDCQLETTFCADGSNQWTTDNPIVVERETRTGTGSVTLTEPRSGLVTGERVIPVAGEVTDPGAERITLVVNGEERQVSVEDGRFRTMVPLVRGQNSIQAFLSSTAFSDRITVRANVVAADVWIELTWDGPADIDLHLYLPDGEHVYYADEVSSSGAELDVDNTERDGPEHITMTQAIRGEYRVTVLYFGRGSRGGGGQVPWQVLVRLSGGQVAERYSGVLNRPGEETVVYTFVFR